MHLPIVKRHYTLKFDGEFKPKVRIRNNVQIGSVLGFSDHYRVLQEIPLSAVDQLLVDDGTYVSEGEELAKAVSLLKQKIFLADKSGIVRITKHSLQIVDIQEDYKYLSPVKGTVLFADYSKVSIEAYFYEYWMLASLGKAVRGHIELITSSSNIITSKQIPSNLNGKILVVGGFLTFPVIIKALNAGTIGIIGSSIDFADYKKLNKVLKYINLGVLLGFGQIVMPDLLINFFKQYNNNQVLVDFNAEKIFLPVKELFVNKNEYAVFSGSRWAIPISKPTLREIELNKLLEVKPKRYVLKDALSVDSSEIFIW